MKTSISKTTTVEDLIDLYPGAVPLMIRHNLPCLVCGEPVWGTIEDLAHEKGYSLEEIEALIDEMNETLTRKKAR